MTIAIDRAERAGLRQFLVKRFSLSELKDLAFDLGVSYEVFAHERVTDLVRELISYCEHRDQLRCLVTQVARRRPHNDLKPLLARLPTCSSPTKVQVILSGDYGNRLNEQELRRGLAALLQVAEAEVAIIGAAVGSLRLLVSVPEEAVDSQVWSKTKSFGDGKYQVAEIEVFDFLGLTSQQAWRMVASEWPPVLQGDVLQATVSWDRVLRVTGAVKTTKDSRFRAAPEATFASIDTLRSTFAPSAQLDYEQVPRSVQGFLERSRACRLRFEFRQALGAALSAREFCREAQLMVGGALARLHMAETLAEVGEIGQAMELCEEARRTLHRQPYRAQRHNEAIAAYTLGVLTELQFFSDDVVTLQWYQEALQLLNVAQQHWTAQSNQSRLETCQRVRNWIKDQTDRIVRSRASTDPWQAVFDVWRPGSTNAPFTRKEHLRGHVTQDGSVKIGGAFYGIRFGTLPKRIEGNRYFHFAFPVPENQWALPDARVGDYVLIRQQWQVDEEGTGVVWGPGSGWDPAAFMRDRDGMIRFSYLPRIIGDTKPELEDPAGTIRGLITALFVLTAA